MSRRRSRPLQSASTNIAMCITHPGPIQCMKMWCRVTETQSFTAKESCTSLARCRWADWLNKLLWMEFSFLQRNASISPNISPNHTRFNQLAVQPYLTCIAKNSPQLAKHVSFKQALSSHSHKSVSDMGKRYESSFDEYESDFVCPYIGGLSHKHRPLGHRFRVLHNLRAIE